MGVNVSGLIATSALPAGIVGLALQEVLGNLTGGAAIHADGAIREDVWSKLENSLQAAKPLDLLSRIQRHSSIDRGVAGAARLAS